MLICRDVLLLCEHRVQIRDYLDDNVMFEGLCEGSLFLQVPEDIFDSYVACICIFSDCICIKVYPEWFSDVLMPEFVSPECPPDLPFSEETEVTE